MIMYEYFFYKLYHWNRMFFPSHFKIDDAIVCGYLTLLITLQLVSVFNILEFLNLGKNIFSGTRLIEISGMVIYAIHYWYFSKSKRYEVIIAKYYNEIGYQRNLGTLAVLVYIIASVLMFLFSTELTWR